MGNEIPTRSREKVRERDGDQCQRCGSGRNLAWHHRRRRAVKGHFQHCPCIGIQLCPTDHEWAHKHPKAAQDEGFIISSHEEEPWSVPVKTFAGWCINDCEGDSQWVDAPQ